MSLPSKHPVVEHQRDNQNRAIEHRANIPSHDNQKCRHNLTDDNSKLVESEIRQVLKTKFRAFICVGSRSTRKKHAQCETSQTSVVRHFFMRKKFDILVGVFLVCLSDFLVEFYFDPRSNSNRSNQQLHQNYSHPRKHVRPGGMILWSVIYAQLLVKYRRLFSNHRDTR